MRFLNPVCSALNILFFTFKKNQFLKKFQFIFPFINYRGEKVSNVSYFMAGCPPP